MRRRSVVGAAIGSIAAAYILLVRPRLLRWGATEEEHRAAVPRRRAHRDPQPRRDPRHRRPCPIRRRMVVDRAARTGAGWVLQLRFAREPGRLRHPQRRSDRPGVAAHHGRGRGQVRPRGGLDVVAVDTGAFARPARRCPDGKTPPPFDFSWAFASSGRSHETTGSSSASAMPTLDDGPRCSSSRSGQSALRCTGRCSVGSGTGPNGNRGGTVKLLPPARMTPVVRDEEGAGSNPGHPDSVKHQVRGSRREASLALHPARQRRESAKSAKTARARSA